ncbi:putative nucleotidyltransferase substrate binding domain-containing protein [Hydrogenovibrio kuenenii]|uniref:putative nucleotidyltransferase substrate binding domain-containing protein n=1 Tax=Hydrogenovibrio kuenenii TaxID=63658 RepID=UPI000464FE00|nr:putative nucleotidyltransferase substrate binding domain-containing protein [Hydrogenovibrio kuenenii]
MHNSPVINLLHQLEPFSNLPEQSLQELAASMDVVYFPQGSKFALQLHENPEENASLYILIKGRIAEFDNEGRQTALYLHHTFFGESVLLKKLNESNYEVKEEAIAYRLPGGKFLEWVKMPELANYFFNSITDKLDQLHKSRQMASSSEALMELVVDAPVKPLNILSAQATVASAISQMATTQVDACLVKLDRASHEVQDVMSEYGILTAMDLLKAISHDPNVLNQAVDPFAQSPVISVHRHDYLFNALLKMTRHYVNRLVIRGDNEPVGFLYQKDLMGHFATQSGLGMLSLEQVTSREEIEPVLRQVDDLITNLNARGVKTHYIAKLATEVYRKVFQKVFDLLEPDAVLQSGCFIVMGSEGRAEQVMRTDQDNAFILPEMDEQTFETLKPFAERLTQSLIDLGFPRCPGEVMVCNPLWFQPINSFKQQLKSWMNTQDETGFMNVSIFLDAEVVFGDEALLKDCKQLVSDWVKNYPQFLRHFAKPVFQFETPVNFFGRLVSEKQDQQDLLDLKKGGIFAIVHGVRCLALEFGISQTNTHWRIKALMESGFFSESFGHELGESLNFFNTLRLENMIDLKQSGVNASEFESKQNKIQVTNLTTIQQDLLKDAFDVVKRFKKMLNHHYKLDTLL